MMKKRIVALLLAGLMSATALASCVARNNNNNPNGTEPNQNPPTGQTTPDPNTNVNPPVISWQDVDKSVFTVNDVTLREEASNNSTALASIPKETELHCTKQSTSWYYVEYEKEGQLLNGYVSKARVTEENILGTDFVEVTGGSYSRYVATEGLRKRLYPSDNDNISTVLGSHKLNDVVTVTHTNGTWSRIQGTDGKTYYLANRHLSEDKVTNPNDDSQYQHLFTPVNGEVGVKKYVSVEQGGMVNFRTAPSTDENVTIILSLSDGCEVTLLKTGTVNGVEWSYVVVLVTSNKEGVPSEYKFGYINSSYLSDTSGEMSIDDWIALYPTLTKIDGGMTYYVLKEATITIRRTPVFPAENEPSNSLANPQSGKNPDTIKAIKVYASGEIDETTWFLVEYTKKEGDKDVVIRGFVGGKALEYLTTDANGNPTVTLDDLIIKYPQFTKLETPTTVTTNGVANCYGTPDATGEVLGQLAQGAQVKLVAQEQGAFGFANWYVIESEGKLFFVGKSFFN